VIPNLSLVPLVPLVKNDTSFHPAHFVVKSSEMWVIAKMPSMGYTWRTAHLRYFWDRPPIAAFHGKEPNNSIIERGI
jgi:hypothetical protein